MMTTEDHIKSGAKARADHLAKAAFDLMANQPAPEHLVHLVDALEASRQAESQAA